VRDVVRELVEVHEVDLRDVCDPVTVMAAR